MKHKKLWMSIVIVLALIVGIAFGLSTILQTIAPLAYANGEGGERFKWLLTIADVEKVTGLKGIKGDGYEFRQQDGEIVLMVYILRGKGVEDYWKTRSRGFMGKSRKIDGLGDEAFEESIEGWGSGLALFVRRGEYVIELSSGSTLKGATLVPRLSSNQLRALAKIMLARM
jgi:hypothetical protein